MKDTENIIESGHLLYRIYKTDPFGFPLYQADEEQYHKSKQAQGLDPDAVSVFASADRDSTQASAIDEASSNI